MMMMLVMMMAMMVAMTRTLLMMMLLTMMRMAMVVVVKTRERMLVSTYEGRGRRTEGRRGSRFGPNRDPGPDREGRRLVVIRFLGCPAREGRGFVRFSPFLALGFVALASPMAIRWTRGPLES